MKGRLLYLIDNNKGLLFHRLAFYDVDLESGRRQLIAWMPASSKQKMLSRCRLVVRLLRMEPRCAGRLDENRFVVNVLGKIWLVDIRERRMTELLTPRQSFSLLNFCEKDGCLYWGDYGDNSNYDDINIYRLDGDLSIKIVYTFPKGSVRHIHNIISAGDGFIVMVGDNEPQAGIYRTNGDWTEMRPWKCGEQKYRAVVGFSYQGGLLYATDSVETENHLRFISADGAEMILETVNGSCIYGGEAKDFFLISTTVEPHEGRGIRKMMSNELGGGIKSKDVHVLAVSKKELIVKRVATYKKDCWPMKVFQYGTCMFAGGQRESKAFWWSPVACKKYDGNSVKLSI